MSLILLLEGHTEKDALSDFLKRWLDSELGRPVRIRTVNLKGSGNFVRELTRKVALYLDDYPDTKGIFGLLDLYGLELPYPKGVVSSPEKIRWAKQHLEEKAASPIFRQHFAVHDVEAWFLSDPKLFEQDVRKVLPKKAAIPETVNFNTPPAELLKKLFLSATGRAYKKIVFAKTAFNKLDPYLTAKKCPALAALLQDMLTAAKSEK